MSEPLALLVDCGDQYLIRVEFAFLDGRFRQTLELFCGEQLVERWADRTESADEDWPGSPPIQQLSLESINGRPTLLGVGQAGKSHWSISVESTVIANEPGLRFDVACRTAGKPMWLGSSYQSSAIPHEADLRSLHLTRDLSFPESMLDSLQVTCPLDVNVESENARRSRSKTFRWGYLVVVR